VLQKLQEISVNASSSTSLNDVMTSSVVASILKRRRPQVTLTLDPGPALGPSGLGQGAQGPSRRSSASIDSGYAGSLAASPTFAAGVVPDIFTPPPPLPPPGGPLTAPLPSLQSPAAWGFKRQPVYPPPANAPPAPPAVYSHCQRHPPGLARPPVTADYKNQLYFVFDA